MAISQAQSPVSAGQSGTTIALTLAGSPTDGHLLVSRMFTRSSTVTNPTGFTTAIEIVNATEDDRARIAYRIASGDGATHTWTGLVNMGTGAAGSGADLVDYQGNETSSVLDKTASTGRTSATSISSGTTATLSQADELACAVFGMRADVGSLSLSNSYTQISDVVNTDVAAVAELVTADLVTSGTGAQETTLSYSPSAVSIAAIATFKAASGGGGGPVIPVFMAQYRQRWQ